MPAVDTLKEMIRVFSEKLHKRALEHIKPLRYDIVSEPLSDKFQFVFTSMALHHVEDSDRAIRALAQHLEPGGMPAIADLDENEHTFHQDRFNRKKIAEKLQSLGFSAPDFIDVHTFLREDKTGNEHPFTVFLLSCKLTK